ncbi:hypothetical protein QF043_002872 [Pseudomonas sp. W3I7]|jgi:hypothetical protein|uniref:DUF6555 family protein n=1 Tax=Pseudomonas sp. W3I7 TaxID=3042292 RepID=UPI0027905352|nr:DUF6555 family protein [Pseudomonas sp. W3I7]MDQ0704080.1 hypothetical protein [Pseudomonas sp. W3I7]
MNSSLFIIEYFIHNMPKAFIIRADTMNNAEAWHWACCDADIGIIPKSRHDKFRRISKPLAERYGIAQVTWRPSGSIPFIAKPYAPPPPE